MQETAAQTRKANRVSQVGNPMKKNRLTLARTESCKSDTEKVNKWITIAESPKLTHEGKKKKPQCNANGERARKVNRQPSQTEIDKDGNPQTIDLPWLGPKAPSQTKSQVEVNASFGRKNDKTQMIELSWDENGSEQLIRTQSPRKKLRINAQDFDPKSGLEWAEDQDRKGSDLVQLWHENRTTTDGDGLKSHQRRWERIANLECCWESVLGTKFESKLTSCQSLTLERRKMRVQLSQAKRRLSEIIGETRTGEMESMGNPARGKLSQAADRSLLGLHTKTIRRAAVKKGLTSSPLALRDMSFSATPYSTQPHSARSITKHVASPRFFFGNSKQSVENAWLMVSSISERNAILTGDREPVETVWAQLGPLAPATRTYITERNEERMEGHSDDVLDDYHDWALGNSLRNKCRALVKYVPLKYAPVLE
ncbi:hypothetical protein DFH06DRAFT_1140681 [Mycena polygramma]|nr:hypothetical protein DFH06DRAFT_1140681 [Mycena polygramma]